MNESELTTITKKSKSWVYFLQSGNYVKIGYTVQSVNDRIKTLKLACPEPPKVLAIYIGSKEVESQLHNKFRAHRSNGEWFRLVQPIKNFLKRNGSIPFDYLDTDWYDFLQKHGREELIADHNRNWYHYKVSRRYGLTIIDPRQEEDNPKREVFTLTPSEMNEVASAWNRVNHALSP